MAAGLNALREWLDASTARRVGVMAASVALGAMLAIGILSYAITHSLLERQVRATLDAELQLTAQRLAARLDGIAEDLAGLARNSLVSNALVDSQGRDAYLVPFLREYRIKPEAPFRLSLHDYTGAVLASGEPAPGIAEPAPRSVALGISSGRPGAALHGRDGRVLEILQPVAFPTTGTVEGALLLEVDLPAVFAAAARGLREGFSVELQQADGALIGAAGRKGSTMLTAAATLNLQPPLDRLALRVSLGLDNSQALASLRQMAVGYVAVGWAATLLIVGAALTLARRATARLRLLSDTAQQVAAAGPGGAAVKVAGRDEIAQLAEAFNLMLARLHASQRDLEDQVEERTARLAEVRDRLASVLQSVRDVIWSASLDRSQYLYVSPASSAVFGIDAEPLMMQARLLQTLIHPDDAPAVRAGLAAVRAAGEAQYVYRIAGDGGEARWLEERAYLVRDAAGVPLRIDGITSDVTDRIAAEDALRLRERALATSSNGVILVDMLSPGEPVSYVNEAFQRITGYRADEIIGRTCRLLQRDDRDQPGLRELREAIAARRSFKVTLRNYRKDGSLFYNELAISPVRDREGWVTHYLGIQNDVTERLQAEAALRERTFSLDAIFTLSPDGFVAFDGGGRLRYVNPAFGRMTGLDEAQLAGLDLAGMDLLLRTRCDPEQPYDPLLAQQDGAEPAPAQQAAVLQLREPARRILTRRVVSGEGDAGTILYFRDVTHETEVERLKSEFLSTAAHELRTPMSSIFGFSELLMQRDFDDATRREVAATIHRQAGLLVQMVNDLLDLARIEARGRRDFHIRRQPLQPLIEGTLQSLLVPGDARAVRTELPAAMPWVAADAAKLQQALTNLLANAYKYSPGGGDIVLAVAVEERDEGCWAAITVRDRGMGMTPDQLARAFERFYRADPSGRIPGTGLGLSLVKEIAEAHAGRVSLESRPGVGTAATLWLPVVAAEAGADAQQAA